ncbi:hypothetical protein F4Y93_13185 [Candidatus Poribacteria bacterium]|nr:hypothetical protein [Candidatus Poribacteria bacterium]
MKVIKCLTLILVITTAMFVANGSAQNSLKSIKVDGAVNDLKYSPDGTLLAVATSKGLWLYDAETLDKIKTLTRHKKAVNALAFSGNILASVGMDKTVQLWNSDTGKRLNTLQGHKDTVKALAFSMNGKTLASADNNMLCLWNIPTGTIKKVVEGGWAKANGFGNGSILVLAFSQNDSKIICRTAYTRSVSFVDPVRTEIFNESYPDLRRGTGRSFSSTLFYYTKISALVLFPTSGETFATAEASATLGGHTGEIEIEDINVHLWSEDKKGPKVDTNHKDLVNVLALSPNGDFLATGSADKTIQVIDVGKKVLLKTLDVHENEVTALVFSPDDKMLVSGDANGTIVFHDVSGVE